MYELMCLWWRDVIWCIVCFGMACRMGWPTNIQPCIACAGCVTLGIWKIVHSETALLTISTWYFMELLSWRYGIFSGYHQCVLFVSPNIILLPHSLLHAGWETHTLWLQRWILWSFTCGAVAIRMQCKFSVKCACIHIKHRSISLSDICLCSLTESAYGWVPPHPLFLKKSVP